MTNDTRGILSGFCTISTVFALLAVTAVAQVTSSTQQIKGTATTVTRQEHGTVTYVEGNNLVIRMSTGEVRNLTVPDTRTAMVDGKEITVHDLKVGTTLTATITTTTTPITERTVSNLTGKVWYVSGNTVILTLADGTNKMYKARDGMKFKVDGQDATVFDLRKGMRISAEKIVEEPTSVVANNTTVVGHAPKPAVVAQAPVPKTMVARAAPAPAPVEAAPAPAPAPAESSLPAKLPKTGSPLPLAGMLGLMFTGAGLGLRMLRR